jgi:hypothetical protein
MFQDLYAKAWPKNLDILGGECPVSEENEKEFLQIAWEGEPDETPTRPLELQEATSREAVKGRCREFMESVRTSTPALKHVPLANGVQ